MLRVRREATDNVAAALHPVERASDEFTALTARCIATMLEERVKAGLSFELGAEAVRMAGETLTHSLQNRDRLIQLHTLLRAIPSQIGIHGYGDNGCPDMMTLTNDVGLAIVPKTNAA